MALLAGIDEAGYGPTLGPLIVTGVTVGVPDDQIQACLWDKLQGTCTAKVERFGGRLTVADSKVLYRNRRNLSLLERTALVMFAVSGNRPQSWRSLLEIHSPQSVKWLTEYPWYATSNAPLPLAEGVGDIITRANAVLRNFRAAGIGPLSIFGESLLARQYNHLLKRTHNKSVVLLGLVMRLVDGIMRSTQERRIRICVDRLGGRLRYRDALLTSFPGRALQILRESPGRSAYRLTRSNIVCDIEFAARGEHHHFLVALASIFSKYVREIYMHLLNKYWCSELPGLKPTAGYYTDSQRWLSDVSEALGRRGVDRSILVRER